MRAVVRIFIRIYQVTLSPVLSFLAGPGGGCRFSPTCSEYFLGAVQEHGFWKGSWLGGKRLLRCQPWGGSGFDPVPPGAIRDKAVVSAVLSGQPARPWQCAEDSARYSGLSDRPCVCR